MDYSSITAAADWDTVLTGIAAVGAALAVVLVAMKGARKLLGFIGR